MAGGAAPASVIFSTFDLGFFGSGAAASAQIHPEDYAIDQQIILGSTQTPGFSTFRKTRCRDVVHSWSVDALATTATGGGYEGAAFSGVALTAPVRLFNGTQIFDKHVQVSDRERESVVPGNFRDQYEKQVFKAFKEITRNSECRIWDGVTTASATGAEGTAPVMGGMQNFGITTAQATLSGAPSMALGDIYSLGVTMFNNGVEPDSLWFSPTQKMQFFNAVTGSTTSVNVRNIAATDNRFQANVEVMESPLGFLLAIIVDRWIPTYSATANGRGAYYMIDRSMVSLPFFRPPQHKPMGKAGDDTRGIVLMEHTLKLDHPSAVGAVVYITATGF